jgi:DNA-binding response OmpR family regulator
LSDRHILIAEDDAGIRDFLEDALTMQGYTVRAVSDGSLALEALAAEAFDLLLSDVRMPNLDGIELCRRAHALHAHMPVILMTGLSAEENEAILKASGAHALLHKPIRIQRLQEILCSAGGSR